MEIALAAGGEVMALKRRCWICNRITKAMANKMAQFKLANGVIVGVCRVCVDKARRIKAKESKANTRNRGIVGWRKMLDNPVTNLRMYED